MRQVSQAALQAIMAQDTEQVFIPILKIEHDDLDAPILLAYNTKTVTRTDGDYLPYPFQINLPVQSDEEIPTVQLTVDNTSLEVNDKLRVLVGQPKVTFSVVLADTPDTVEAGPFVLSLQGATADVNSIQGTLGFEDGIFSQSVPAQQFLPTNSSGLFT